MLIYPEFPPNRRQDPKRQAEWRVYQAFDESDRDGHALYELKVGRHAPEVDFFALIQDKVVVCMQVKGGQYRVEGRQLVLGDRRRPRIHSLPHETHVGLGHGRSRLPQGKARTENLHGRRPAAAGHGTGS